MFSVVITNMDKYLAVVYSCSYTSPISYLKEIESQIEKVGIEDGYILFDTLLSKGNTSNRFLEAYCKDGHFVKSTFKNIDIPKAPFIRKNSSCFYKESGINLDNSLLTDVQKRIITSGFVL